MHVVELGQGFDPRGWAGCTVAAPPKNLKSQSQKTRLRFRLSWWYPPVNTRSARRKPAVTATVHQPEGCIVPVPSLWPRPGGVLQQHGLGVLRPSGGANAVAGCWPTYGEESPTCLFRTNISPN